MSTHDRQKVVGCKAGCGVMLFVLVGLVLFPAGLFLLIIASSGVQLGSIGGTITLVDIAVKIVLPFALGIIALLNGVYYWWKVYKFWKRT